MAYTTHRSDLYPAFLVRIFPGLKCYVKAIPYIASRRCPMCQDYLASLMREVDHAALARSGVRLVVIGCGSYGLIRSYRRMTFIT